MIRPISKTFFARYVAIGGLAISACAVSAAGRVVVCGDEWALNNSAFTAQIPDSAQYVKNVFLFLAGPSGKILDTTDIPTVGSSLQNKLVALGYQYTKDTTSAITPALLAPYKAVVFGGLRGRCDVPANKTTLMNYVAAGGSVYIFTGTGFFGTPAAEAAGWNPFTQVYGITIGPNFINPPAATHVTLNPGYHTLRSNMNKFTFGFGNAISTSGSSAVALSGGPELSQNIGMVGATYAGKYIIGFAELRNFGGAAIQHVQVDFLDPGGRAVSSVNAEVLQPGNYFAVEAPDLGHYIVSIKVGHWLRQNIGPVDLAGDLAPLSFSLTNGDIDGDNAVTLLDYDIFSQHFDKDRNSPDWYDSGTGELPASAADLDGDEYIGLLDYDVFSESFDKIGDPIFE